MERLYLLLHYQYKGDYWDFPRGNIKEQETGLQAALRETREETGLSENDLTFVEGFEETIKWLYRSQDQSIVKLVTYYLAQTKREDVRISGEHVGFKWLRFKDALQLLKFKSSRSLLRKAESHVLRQERQATCC